MQTRSSAVRTAGVALTVAAAVGAIVFTPGDAHADTYVRLPGGRASGQGFTVTRSNESAVISPSLAMNGASRTAWVSGDITLRAPGIGTSKVGPNNGASGESSMPGTNGTSIAGEAARISTGYIIGCQVNIEGLSTSLSGALTTTAPSLSGSLSIPLEAGEVTFASIGYKSVSKPGTYYLGYNHVQLAIQNCAGYAQARAFTTIETTGTLHQKVNLYGKPFSIG